MKCEYCGNEIKGRPYYFQRFKRFEIVPVITEEDPKDFAPLRHSVCIDCMKDMGIRFA